MQEATFTTANAAIAAMTLISGVGSEAPTGDHRIAPQVARFLATGNHASTLATLAVAVVDPTAATTARVIAWYTASVTATARRTNEGNTAADDYVCDVSFLSGGAGDKLDLLGMCEKNVFTASDSRLDQQGLKHYFGISSLTNATSIKVRCVTTRAL